MSRVHCDRNGCAIAAHQPDRAISLPGRKELTNNPRVGSVQATLPAKAKSTTTASGAIPNPKLWGSPPEQTPNRYAALTRVYAGERLLDSYETRFGVRSLEFDGERGFVLNDEVVELRGVCNHHDLGALGAALNTRALTRQFEILAEMGSNAIRTAHNPPAPELLEIADRMGFLIMDEVFDVWEQGKADLDHHVFFADWHEQDLRALIRRDRNHPSIFAWVAFNETWGLGHPEPYKADKET